MQKQKLLKLFFNTFSVISLLTLAKPANAGNIFDGLGGALLTAIAKLLGWMADIISSVLFNYLLNPILSLVKEDPNLLLNHPIAQSAWTGALAVANGLFLFALVLASVAIILRLNTGMYNLKKVLGGFITAVILSNLSLLIVRVLVELGDNLTTAAYGLFASIDPRLTHDVIDGPNGFIMALTQIKALGGAGGGAGADNQATTTAILLGIIIMVLIFWILLKLTLIYIERMFWLFLLAISAPIIFALSLLPTTQKLAADWWNKLIKWILVLPLVASILSIAVYFLILTVEDPNNPNATINPAEFVSQLTDPTFFADLLASGKGIFLIIGLIILYQAGRANNLLGISSGASPLSGAVDTPKKMQGTAKAGFKPIADTFTGKNPLGKAIGHTRGLSGKGLNRAGDAIANKFPNSKRAQKLKGLGTQVGAIPKVFGAWTDASRKDEDRKRKEQTGRLTQQLATTPFVQALDPEAEERLARSSLGDDYTEANKRSSGGFEQDIKNTGKAKTYSEYRIAMIMANSAAHSRETPKIERNQYADYAQKHQAYYTNADDRTTEQQQLVDSLDPETLNKITANEAFERKRIRLKDRIKVWDKKHYKTTGETNADTNSSTATVSMVSYMQAGRKIKRLERLLNNLGKNDFKALQMAQNYHDIVKDNPENQAQAEAILRDNLNKLGVTDKKQQNVIIDTAKAPVVKKMLNTSNKTKPANNRPDTTGTRLNATIETLSSAQQSANIVVHVKAKREKTISSAQDTIIKQVNNGDLSQGDVDTINSNSQNALDKIGKALENNPDVQGANKLSSLDLDEEVLKDIQNSFDNSSLVTGKNLDRTDQINNASIDTVLEHLDTVNQATTKRNPTS